MEFKDTTGIKPEPQPIIAFVTNHGAQKTIGQFQSCNKGFVRHGIYEEITNCTYQLP